MGFVSRGQVLDLSSNGMGSGIYAGATASALGDVFATNDVLFHVSIAHNGFRAPECALMRDKIACNHTLGGLHVGGACVHRCAESRADAVLC